MRTWGASYLPGYDKDDGRVGAVQLCQLPLKVPGAPDIHFPEMTLHFHVLPGVNKPLAQLEAKDLNPYACHVKPSHHSKIMLPIPAKQAIWLVKLALQADQSGA